MNLSPDTPEPSCDLVRQTAQLFEKDFELAPGAEADALTYQLLLENITRVIRRLIEQDPQRLVYLMYRLDVSETKFREALALSDVEQVASQVAELVLEREKQKVYWRNRYK